MKKKKYIILTMVITAIVTAGIILGVQYFSEYVPKARFIDGEEKLLKYAVFTDSQNNEVHISKKEVLRLSEILKKARTRGRIDDYESVAKTDFILDFSNGSTMNFCLWDNKTCFINGEAYKISIREKAYEEYCEFVSELSEKYFTECD